MRLFKGMGKRVDQNQRKSMGIAKVANSTENPIATVMEYVLVRVFTAKQLII